MRVIAGTARSLPLKCIEGLETRPTTDRIKETLFNMIQQELPGCRFLDLFAGSGAIGIEALSRGAKEAVFVENQRKAWSCIKENLSFTRLSERAHVILSDAVSAIRQMEGEPSFDLVFMDPPYDQGLEQQVLAALAHSTLVDSHTILILEASKKSQDAWMKEYGFTPWRVKSYKTNRHVFISRTEEKH